MKPSATSQQVTKTVNYEQVTRCIRWIVLGIVLVTLPFDQPQTPLMLGLIVLGIIFNLSRYSRLLMKQKWFASNLTMIIADNLLVATLLLVVSRIDLPYSGLLGLIIITATYWYGIKGTFGVVAGQLAILGAAAILHLFPDLTIDPVRSVVLACGLLITYGLLLEQLTRVERLRRDRLEQLEREQSIIDSRLMTLINSLGDAVAAVDGRGNITVANTALSEISGIEKDLNGTQIGNVLHLKHKFKDDLNWANALRDAPARYRDYFVVGTNGGQISIELNIVPIGQGDESAAGYIVICHDITKDKTLDEQRQEFIAVTSHELRTPLTIIEGALSLALSPKNNIDAKIQPVLEQAHRSVQFLGGLIEDLTLLSKAQNDNIEIQPKVVDPKALIGRLVQDYAPQAKEKNLALKSEINDNVPTLLTTERHVEEIMRNLVSNGIKYTASGEVVIRAERAKNDSVLFSVQDTGAGISQPDQERLFTKFFRAENFQTREIGGTGLGLYICQEIAERINAKLWCKSSLGHGSTFFLEVPPFSKLEKDQAKVVTAGVSNLIDQL